MKVRLAVALALGVLGSACHGGAYQAAAPAPQPAAAAPAGPSLYERLGGVDAIRAVVNDFVGRVVADERISVMFRGVDADDFKGKLVDLICQTAGGPCVYRGRSMREAHTGMHVTNEQFDALVGDLVASLNQFNVPEREKNELLTALGGMRGEIVGH